MPAASISERGAPLRPVTNVIALEEATSDKARGFSWRAGSLYAALFCLGERWIFMFVDGIRLLAQC